MARRARELRAKPEPRAKREIEREKGLEREFGEPLPRKSVKIETYYFSLISLFSFLMRGIVVKPPKATMYRGVKCRWVVLRVVFLPKFENVCKFQDQNLQIYGSYVFLFV